MTYGGDWPEDRYPGAEQATEEDTRAALSLEASEEVEAC